MTKLKICQNVSHKSKLTGWRKWKTEIRNKSMPRAKSINIYRKISRHRTQLTVPVDCVKTTYMALVLLLFQFTCTRQFMQVLFITFCKSKISFNYYHWKVVCEIIRNTVGEIPLDKLYNHIRFFFYETNLFVYERLHHC